MWDAHIIGEVFALPEAPAPVAHTPAASVSNHFFSPSAGSGSGSGSFDFGLSSAQDQPQRHHDSHQLSTFDIFATPVTRSTTECVECGELLKQLGESLDNLDRVQAENATLKENLSTLSNRTKSLFSAQDCDLYEQELMLAFQGVKARRVSVCWV